MNIKTSIGILVVAASASACAASTNQYATAPQPQGFGMAANDDLWVDQSHRQTVYRAKIVATTSKTGDLWMAPAPSASETSEFVEPRPRLDRVLGSVTPRQLASGSESQSLAF